MDWLVLLGGVGGDDLAQFDQGSVGNALWGRHGDIGGAAQRVPGAGGGAFAQGGVLEPRDVIDLLQLLAGFVAAWEGRHRNG